MKIRIVFYGLLFITMACSDDDSNQPPTIIDTPCNLPTPTASYNTGVGMGESVRLFSDEVLGATYHWMGPNGFTSEDQNPIIPNATVDMEGVYSVTVMVGNCESEAGLVSVTVDPHVYPCNVENNSGRIGNGTQFTITQTSRDAFQFMAYSQQNLEFWISLPMPNPPAGVYEIGSSIEDFIVHVPTQGGGISTYSTGGQLDISYNAQGKMKVVFCNVPCVQTNALLNPPVTIPAPSITAKVTEF